MALIKCEKCGKMISDRTRACPKCGYGISKTDNITPSTKTKPKLTYLLVILVIAALLYYVGALLQKSAEKDLISSDNLLYSTEITNSSNDISWLFGSWECSTEYGRIQVEVSESSIIYKNGSNIEKGNYRIDGNILRMQCSGYTTTFELDFVNQRIDMGEGHWMHKTNSSGISSERNDNSYSFTTAQDVFAYLSSCEYCKGSNCITFHDMCLYTNGSCATAALEVVEFNETQAILEAYSPLLGGRIRFRVDKRGSTGFSVS